MKQIRIVVTGGPSGGKTTLIEALRKELGHQAVIVPEAASILYRGGFPRLKTPHSALCTQRAIYSVQKELEELVPRENRRAQVTVCDRGSLDGVAYWPRAERDFFRSVGCSRAAELRRYDWVLHLD